MVKTEAWKEWLGKRLCDEKADVKNIKNYLHPFCSEWWKQQGTVAGRCGGKGVCLFIFL